MENLEIYKWFVNQSPIVQALIGGLFTWGLTALGASLVFFFKTTNRKVLDMCLGFTGGVMIAASFWSLLSPAIATVEKQQELGITNLPVWFAPAVGFLLGALFFDLWGAETNLKKALFALSWTAIFLIALFYAERNKEE